MIKFYTFISALLLISTTNLFAQQAIPFTDGFEDGSLQSYWTTGGSVTPSVSTDQVYSGTYALAFNNTASSSSYVEIELESATDPLLSFWYYFGDYWDRDLTIDIYTNGSWTTDIWTANVDDYYQWWQAEVDLSAYDTESGSFKLRFNLTDNAGFESSCYLDEVMVGAPSNPNPNNSSDNALTGTLTWDHGANVSTYDVKFGEAGNMTTAVSNEPVSGTSGSYSYSNLNYAQKYEWQIIYHKTDGTQFDGPVWSFYTLIGTHAGTETDPHEIASVSDLIYLSQNNVYWDKHFIQTADITFNADETQEDWNGNGSPGPAEGFLPIGNNTTKFTGSYDGQNNTIDNLYISRPSTSYVGLFGYLTGSVQYLNLTNTNITGDDNVGGIAGRFMGSTAGNTISHCSSSGTVNGDNETGGLIGYLSGSGSIDNCSSSGSVTTTTTTSDNTGGLVGKGYNSIQSSSSSATVDGTRKVGGLIGYNGGTIDDCHASGNVTGENDVGGFAGYSYRPVTNSSATGSTVTGKTGSDEIGGFVGDNRDPLTNCYSTCDVTGDTEKIGGFVGNNTDPIDNSYSTGSVTGSTSSTDVGGFAGYNKAAISNSYSTGNTDGNENVGGFAGNNDADNSTGSLTNCYSAGSVTGSTATGGLVGLNDGSVSNSFWDKTVEPTDNGIGTGLTTTQMQDYNSFTDETNSWLSSAWDFVGTENDDSGTDDYWGINYNGQNNGYPFLTWQDYDHVVSQPGLWTGATSTDWHTASNWDDGQVPGTGVNVTIPDTGNDPEISAAATCQNITIENNSTLTIISSQTLNVTGNFTLETGGGFTNNGALKFSGNACELSDNRAEKSSLGNVTVGN